MSASTCTLGALGQRGARVVGRLARDDRDVRDVEVVGPREHAADDLAREARRVELAFARHREVGALERGFEPDRLGHDLEARRELRADRGEPARETTRRARAGRAASTSTPVRVAVLVGEHLQAGASSNATCAPLAPFCGPYTVGRVEERRSRRRTRP